MAAESLVALCMVAILAVACNGGGTQAVPAYTVSAGVGEVLQLTVDIGNMIYSYSVLETSYAASGVSVGQNSTGILLGSNPDGTYNVGPSLDGFIQGGKVLLLGGELAGHLSISPTNFPVPVIGISYPAPNLVFMAGVYNYQGFSCSALGIANAASAPSGTTCSSQYGTMTIAVINPANPTSAIYTTCIGGDITNQSATSGTGHPCTGGTFTGTIQPTSLTTPGVYNVFDANSNHIGWFFAFTAPNGQNVGVIDHDDKSTISSAYGHTVLSSYAPLTSGAGDGSYYVNNNEGQENWVTLATTLNPNNYWFIGPLPWNTSTAQSGVQGTLIPNSPWTGLSTISSASPAAASSVVMVTGTGVYTQTSLNDPALFGVGVR